MAGSLRDQMLKKGVVTKKQVKAVEHEIRQQVAEQRKLEQQGREADTLDASAEEAARARGEKAARDRELNRQRDAERLRKEREAQARDLVLAHSLKTGKGDIEHHFTDGGKVKSLHVPQEVHLRIGYGQLGIVVMDGAYHVLPRDAALKVADRMPEAVLVLNDPPEKADPDDPYAVPDDLMW